MASGSKMETKVGYSDQSEGTIDIFSDQSEGFIDILLIQNKLPVMILVGVSITLGLSAHCLTGGMHL